MRKGNKKKKFSLFKFFMILMTIAILYLIGSILLSIKTKNIIIIDNHYYTDDQIIESANIYDYPKFILLNPRKIKNNLMKLDLIEDVTIEKRIDFSLRIKVKEKKILYYIRSKEEYMTSSNDSYKLEGISGIPTLINYVPENVEKSFVREFSKVNDNIINLISEIEYSKTDYDEKRFLLYMNDGNKIYITTSKTDKLNKYVDIVKKLDNKKGILYLDSGNYFEIKE